MKQVVLIINSGKIKVIAVNTKPNPPPNKARVAEAALEAVDILLVATVFLSFAIVLAFTCVVFFN